MKFDVVRISVLFGGMLCSSVIEKIGEGPIIEDDRKDIIVFPMIFFGNDVVVLPTTRFKDLSRDVAKERYAMNFMNHVSDMILLLMIPDMGGGERVDEIFSKILSNVMGERLRKISEDVLSVYKRGKNTFKEIVMMVCSRLLECGGKKEESRMMTVLGKRLICEGDRVIREMSDGMSVEERNERKAFCDMIKRYGEKCCDVKRWKRVMRAESIVCDGFASVYGKLLPEEILGLLGEGYCRKTLKAKGLSGEKLDSKGYMEYGILDTELLLSAYDEHGHEVVEEIVKQMMMGKDGREIDSEYVEKIAQVVDERRRREEREASEHADKLLEEELLGKKSVRKAKAKKGKRSKKSLGGMEEEAESPEPRDEELAGAVGGLSIEHQEHKKGINHYRIHKRVLVWMRDVSSIKRALDRGKEEKWKGKSMNDIERQKITHDIVEVVRLLRSEDRDRFFMPGESWVENDVPRHRKVAVGVLEIAGERMTGIVEASSYKDKDGSDVIYHLMFRRTNVKEIGGVVSQGEDFSRKMESTSCGEFSESKDGSGFLYGKGMRCEVWHDFDKFVVT
ncbi:putative interB family protein [Encephalitozoon hellem ATCC 50504]|uniref:DUF1609 domain-containing protein n=1 Tax=Encephalitozoon hellem TaxID=27973 RepID=A0A9Q9CAF1_ENCHE|nr:putative interB family protein [Encephalitozoon hellem ATCC 50504]AFM98216.1 putative interB family protein [Encephalitozoon hellem ATCC 50504]UTX42888.1 DUF1609 domain-containing protein [Encephalitozoon hellem]UTX43091.1 DUF1609 domain-containing protein [Encephalitozoon hellem]UTX43288.1 DUF1609 domain-containing protein [Encephalitozoon hellem]|eukprot:XP_003887197.1 putative interB family protein [Encephalitozoon hellem ATCC 50504]